MTQLKEKQLDRVSASGGTRGTNLPPPPPLLKLASHPYPHLFCPKNVDFVIFMQFLTTLFKFQPRHPPPSPHPSTHTHTHTSQPRFGNPARWHIYARFDFHIYLFFIYLLCWSVLFCMSFNGSVLNNNFKLISIKTNPRRYIDQQLLLSIDEKLIKTIYETTLKIPFKG